MNITEFKQKAATCHTLIHNSICNCNIRGVSSNIKTTSKLIITNSTTLPANEYLLRMSNLP